MPINNKRYQIGNYIQDWQKKIAMVKEIDQRGILAQYAEEATYKLEWHDITPLNIKVDLLHEMGFETIKQKENPYHRDLSLATRVNGKFYNIRGIVYDDKAIWVFQGITVLYVHQVQNILSIIEPTIDLDIHLMNL
jgi:hypothetical protein